ncbi:MAG: threonylcarbamoyl-AMP synthase [Chitinivibrionales bacterium]|nr:threonylcarbamoyl-AMP synthase [Chitinivibrionales bacterium]
MLQLRVHPKNPQQRILEQAVDIMKNRDGLCIYPTDTVYGMGVCATNPKAIDKIATVLHKDKRRLFSFICNDFSQASQYVKISTNNYRLMKHYLPGPYTFILPATSYVPKKVCPKRTTVGIRIPNCQVTIDLVALLGVPLANTSLNAAPQQRSDPASFDITVTHEIDVILDSGPLDNPLGSTIVDLTQQDCPVVLRHGKGPWYE